MSAHTMLLIEPETTVAVQTHPETLPLLKVDGPGGNYVTISLLHRSPASLERARELQVALAEFIAECERVMPAAVAS